MTGVLGLTGQLHLVGLALIGVGVGHVALPRLLRWPDTFATMDPLSRQVTRAHTFFIGLACILFGLAPLLLTRELLYGGRLGVAVLLGECVFWGLRWASQFVVFTPRAWRGSRLHTVGYLGFTVLWTWVGGVFVAALVRSIAAHA